MRVLVAVDGSDGSFEAIAQIAPLLRAERDEVVLYFRPPEVRVRSSGVAPRVLTGAQHSFADAVFAEARKRLGPKLESQATTIVGQQDPRRGILVAARQTSADLIVLGARGLSVMERLMLGSVSRAVVHGSEIPVWVARPRVDHERKGAHVLLACESPELAQRPAELLSQFAWPDDTKFTIMTVLFSIFAGRIPDWLQQQARSPDVEEMVQVWAREHDEELRSNAARMKEFVANQTGPLRRAQPYVTEGDPAHLILAAAAREKSDLVIVGTKERWTLGGSILGRVSEAVLNHAGCSVLVVPHRETA